MMSHLTGLIIRSVASWHALQQHHATCGGATPAYYIMNIWLSGYLHPQPSRFRSVYKRQGAAGRQGSTKCTAGQQPLIVLHSDALQTLVGVCTTACQIRGGTPAPHACNEHTDLQLTCGV
jgi:hypothetical protein